MHDARKDGKALLDLIRKYLPGVSDGKVRNVFDLPPAPGRRSIMGLPLLFSVASDRISIFDFILPAEVPGKGEVLTAMNIFWRLKFNGEFPHDLVAFGKDIDDFLPKELRGIPELQKRAVVVLKLGMVPIEGIVRGFLTGTGLKDYLATNPHVICGHALPDGLTDGSRLPQPIFTPSTKAVVGHDENISADGVRDQYGPDPENLCLALYHRAASYAEARGIYVADTKFEVGKDRNGILTVGDEVCTPDSSRFWPVGDYEAAQLKGQSPVSRDKQPVREWGKILGIDKLKPEIPADLERVSHIVVDPGVLASTAEVYPDVFGVLARMSLQDFQHQVMKISS
ncbi:MAG: phosphoribosylaminoimidazolesuccinocarboxamide synthase [Candidatus Paceibacterota bacterium]